MLIFRYSFTDRAGRVHRAPKGHPFAFEVDEEKGSAEVITTTEA